MFKEIRRGMDFGPCADEVNSLIGECEEVFILGPDVLTEQTKVIIGLHGNWATNRRYNNYMQYFADRGFVFIAPTYRHHYQGNQHDAYLGSTSVLDYVADIHVLMDSLIEGKLIPGFSPYHNPVVIGHSMGGLVAQRIAAERFSVAGLVLIGSAPPAGISLHTDRNYKRRIKKYVKLILGGKPYLPDFASLREYVYNRMPENLHQALYNVAVYESGTSSREILAGSADSFLVRFLARRKSQPITIDEQKIRCPVYAINGGEDRIIPWTVALDITGKYVGRENGDILTEMHIFSDFAHWPMSEPGWERSAKDILNWITRKVFPSAEQK